MSDNEEWVDRIIEECVKNAHDKNMNELEMFKAVTKSIAKDAGNTLDETSALRELDPDSKEIRKKLFLIQHYVSYLFRFCEGKV
jgi:hypothetical protein